MPSLLIFLLPALATAVPASFYTGHSCGGLFLYDLDLPSGAGCTTMPLGEQPWSLDLENLPGKCSIIFYSDTSCMVNQVIIEGEGTGGCYESGSQIAAYSVEGC